MSAPDEKPIEITGEKVGDGDYEGWSWAALGLRIEAKEIPAAEEALRSFVADVNELAERYPGITVVGGLRETIDCLSQNLDLARRTLQRETGEQARRN